MQQKIIVGKFGIAMRKTVKGLSFIRLIPILPWVNWQDDRFIMDLQRWRDICKIEDSDRFVLAQLMWQYPEFRRGCCKCKLIAGNSLFPYAKYAYLSEEFCLIQ